MKNCKKVIAGKNYFFHDFFCLCCSEGQSNPTYFIKFGVEKMILRKKPPGKLLRGAHQVFIYFVF